MIFTLFQLHEYVILRQHGLPYTRFGFGVIKALILAKVMLIGEAMKLGRRLSALPRIWIVVGRSAVFALFFLAFELVEEGVRALLTGKDLLHGVAAPGGSSLASVVVAMIMCIMLIPYFAFGELGRTFGANNIWRLLFSPEGDQPAAGNRAVPVRS